MGEAQHDSFGEMMQNQLLCSDDNNFSAEHQALEHALINCEFADSQCSTHNLKRVLTGDAPCSIVGKKSVQCLCFRRDDDSR